MHLELWQWILGGAAALMIGVSKTGVPGIGILVVPLLATVFGGRPSVGIMLPMLILADCFAVAWYRRHAQWDKLVRLLPWVVAGMAIGAATLWVTGKMDGSKDILGKMIGVLTLVILGLRLASGRLGERFTPRSGIGVASTGVAAGFATTVANAAGSIMNIYMAAQRVSKHQFIGTLAWYFFIINLSKVPIYIAVSYVQPDNPVMTLNSLLFTLSISPGILLGVFSGRWLFPRIPEKGFTLIVLLLAGTAAIKLIAG